VLPGSQQQEQPPAEAQPELLEQRQQVQASQRQWVSAQLRGAHAQQEQVQPVEQHSQEDEQSPDLLEVCLRSQVQPVEQQYLPEGAVAEQSSADPGGLSAVQQA
jgi:hypothetical protein